MNADQMTSIFLNRLRKANTVLGLVVDRVVCSEKDVSKNGRSTELGELRNPREASSYRKMDKR